MDDQHHSTDWYTGYLHRVNEELLTTKNSYDSMIAEIDKTDRRNRLRCIGDRIQSPVQLKEILQIDCQSFFLVLTGILQCKHVS